MKNDSKSYSSAKVDVSNAIFPESQQIGFEFRNEIDVWAQIEFRVRHQIQHLKHRGVLLKPTEVKEAATVYYSTRHTLDD